MSEEEEAIALLVASLELEGMHLHYTRHLRDWRTVGIRPGHGMKQTLCNTNRCFRLRLKNLTPQSVSEPIA